MDEFLPGCPSRAEFLASEDCSPSSSMDSQANNDVIDEELNGNDSAIVFYSSDFEQALMDRFLPGCPSRSEFMTGSSSAYAEDVNADFTPNDSTDCSSSSSSSTSTRSPQSTPVLTTINGLAALNRSSNGQKSGKIRRRGGRGGSKKRRKSAQANKENRIRIL
ncbi:hypothetical protein PRIPAC_75448 [Pristionchus pacificus]|uniref:Uncharacterized protein n=1 Tax=Pristionchus pacificus TaxID=54126 RepID=A0A2A6C5Z4_PRIPA|nr:hypothetical protein PRIPAC_75448 [Pristionchus pacificus]|eukprot:PDM73569.1 hypothetical protein PRIPAC_40925 [Pristionchus pacificus]